VKVKFDTLFRGLLALLGTACAWAFWASAQTTTNKAAAATTNQPSALVREVERLRPSLSFRLDEVPFLREHTLLGEPLWKYLASLIYILLAFYAAKLVDLITRVWLKRLAAHAKSQSGDLLLGFLRGPLKLVVFVTLLNIGLNVFDWPERARLYLSKGLILVVAASLTYLAVKLLQLFLETWRRRHAHDADFQFDEQLFSVLRISLTSFVIVVAALVTAQNLDINITAAVASLSIGGLAVGLAAQDTLANLFGAVAVFVDKPFRVGDQIKLDGAEGTVEVVGLRSTRVRNPEGHLVAVPNKTMGNAIITNVTRRTSIKTVMNLGLAENLPPTKVKRALALLREVYRSHPQTQDVWVHFNQFAGAKLNVQIVLWWRGTDYQQYLAGIEEMNLTVKERFEAEGIALP
jgi:MscS family membrane protein